MVQFQLILPTLEFIRFGDIVQCGIMRCDQVDIAKFLPVSRSDF
jgi:hypothetical protein